MALINTPVKPFKAQAFRQGKFIEVSDADLKGKWSVVVFYPADFTFVCPTELEDLAEHYDEFQKMGVEVYSVSTDTHFSHKAWHDTSDAIRKIRAAQYVRNNPGQVCPAAWEEGAETLAPSLDLVGKI